MTADTMQLLDPVRLPLHGKHLIEASAGTGKTFNITRIFLRVLLEKALPVDQILVMTFSHAATEEIRGRVAQTLREAIEFWTAKRAGVEPQISDPVYEALFELHGEEHDLERLMAASLVIDEAAIFTIHGFCQYVLNTFAFETGMAMNAQLHTDNSEWLDTASKDWLRKLQAEPDKLALLASCGWHTPEQFLATFRSAITSPLPQVIRSQEALQNESLFREHALSADFSSQFMHVHNHIMDNQDALREQLVAHKDMAKQLEREQEWLDLLAWLSEAKPVLPGKSVDAIMHGLRYSKNEHVKALMLPVKALKDAVKKARSNNESNLARQEQQQPVIEVVAQGIAAIRKQISEIKAHVSALEFDDLVLGVAQAVSDSPALARTLESLFPVALVDEFQDTDSAQYTLLERVYQNAQHSTLMMIGDPKQAIYGFRGGDIFTYLQASQQADYRWFMDTNWRSTANMVDAYNHLFSHAKFDFDIQYLSVNATDKAKANTAPLVDAGRVPQQQAAMQFVACASEADRPSKAQLKEQQAAWLVNEIQRLFEQCQLGQRPVESRDIAVLVRSASEASVVSQALNTASITHVYMSNQQSVFASVEADDVLAVLNGMYHCADMQLAKACLTRPLFGLNALMQHKLYVEQCDETWEQVLSQLIALRAIWLKNGVLAVLRVLIDDHLSVDQTQAERQVTNYQHLAERLQVQAESEGMHEPDKLITWLHEQIHNPSGNDDSHIQRLEKDENAVQIITQHKSKGLEYPIVFIPFASDYKDASKSNRSPALVCQYYDESRQSLIQQIGDTHDAHQRMIREGQAEATRLLYVAITRAVHRCYVLVSPFDNSEYSALGQALKLSEYGSWEQALHSFCDNNPHCAMLENQQVLPIRTTTASETEKEPMLAPLHRQINLYPWRLWSFSGLTQTSAHWRRSRSDEMEQAKSDSRQLRQSVTTTSNQFPKGAGPGNLLHDLLENKDFCSQTWADDAPNQIASLTDQISPDAVLAWLDSALAMEIALGKSATVCLNQLSMDKTLREAEFYYPLRGSFSTAFSHFVDQFRQHNAPSFTLPDDALQGMMHGFIDLIFEHQGKFYVADYKSTYMGDSIEDYTPEALEHNMVEHNYDVQALIYSVALHRYLHKHLVNYSPEQHFGGAIYLYLRGMDRHNTRNQGIATVNINAEQLQQLDALFASEVSV